VLPNQPILPQTIPRKQAGATSEIETTVATSDDVRIASGGSILKAGKATLSEQVDIAIEPFGDGDGSNATQLDAESSEWLFMLE